MVGLAMALALLGDPGPKISFESPGVSVTDLCAELSRQSGKHVVAWDELRYDLIAVRLKDEPLDEVLKQFALVERAVVLPEGSTINLRPDLQARQKLHDDGLARRAAAIKAIQDEMRAGLSDQPFDRAQADSLVTTLNDLQKKRNDAPDQRTSTDYWVQGEVENLKTPSGRTLIRMFTAIPPEELATIPTQREGVWSTYPTAMEQRVPLDAASLLSELNASSIIWADAHSRLHFSSPAMGQPYGADTDPVKVLRLSVSSGNQPILNLAGFNAKGEISFECITPTWTSKSLKATKEHRDTDVHAPSNSEFVEMPPTVAREIRLWSAYPNDKERQTYVLDPEFIKRFYNPEKFDPVAETFGNAILALAEHENKQLLCPEFDDYPRMIPDSAMTKKGLNISFFKAFLQDAWTKSYQQTEFTDNDTWITLCPSSSETEQRAKFDRPSLGVFCRTARDNRNISLMDVAHFAAGSDEYFAPSGWQALGFLTSAIPDLTGYYLLSQGEWPLESFLGRLSDEQIAQAQKPEGLPLEGCNASQLSALGLSFRFERFSVQGRTDVWKSFNTDGLPNGLPGGGVLHLSVTHGNAFQVDIGDSSQRLEEKGQYMTTETLANRLNPQGHGEKYNSYNLLKICPQQSENYIFDFDFPDGVRAKETLSDYRPIGKPVTSIDALPEPYRSNLSNVMQKGAG